MRHLFAAFVAVSTGVLIFAGGLVTNTGSGTFPFEKVVAGIRYEHTHRLIASTVGFSMIVLALWTLSDSPSSAQSDAGLLPGHEGLASRTGGGARA